MTSSVTVIAQLLHVMPTTVKLLLVIGLFLFCRGMVGLRVQGVRPNVVPAALGKARPTKT